MSNSSDGPCKAQKFSIFCCLVQKYHTSLQAKISYLLFLTPSQMSESMRLYKIGVEKVNFSYSENVTCVCRKNLTAEQKQGCFYLYTSLWRSHRLAHNPALLTGAGLAHTWAWTWLYLTLSWTWSPFTLFRLSIEICHWHCTVHTPGTISALSWQELYTTFFHIHTQPQCPPIKP